jgi:UDP-galactopyranose mutase
MTYEYLIVGAGISGITATRLLAEKGKRILIIDKRNHIGGNCHDYLDKNNFVHKYGPHLFHTDSMKVWTFLSRFTEWEPYKHKVIASYNGKYYPIPINLDTVNQFFNTDLKDKDELIEFLETKKVHVKEIRNSKDVIVSRFGEELYEAFVKYYTKKQWDLFPEELDKSVLERLPIRYDKNPYYFNNTFEGLPKKGYTRMFENMIDSKNITIQLNTDYYTKRWDIPIIIFTGPIDQFFDYRFGKLDYRCIDFRFETVDTGFQENGVVNYPSKEVPFTRITEFSKFYPRFVKKSVICKEYPTWTGEPSYPVPNKKNKAIAEKYDNESKKNRNIYFLGRLGRYRYLNMDKACLDAIELIEQVC